jgi:hypothetical protein
MDLDTITNKIAAQKMLINRLQQALSGVNLDAQRLHVKTISTELGVELLDLAAALVYLQHQDSKPYATADKQEVSNQKALDGRRSTIKMVRYRLNVGSLQRVNVEELKKILVDESGVDKNNIENINIQGSYTLIDLPDNMPQDIFLHLKSVEINHQKLDIRRVKTGNNKKRGKRRSRRARQLNYQTVQGASDQVNGG